MQYRWSSRSIRFFGRMEAVDSSRTPVQRCCLSQDSGGHFVRAASIRFLTVLSVILSASHDRTRAEQRTRKEDLILIADVRPPSAMCVQQQSLSLFVVPGARAFVLYSCRHERGKITACKPATAMADCICCVAGATLSSLNSVTKKKTL